jgi:hypothetical protein
VHHFADKDIPPEGRYIFSAAATAAAAEPSPHLLTLNDAQPASFISWTNQVEP